MFQKVLLVAILVLWGPAALVTLAVLKHDYVEYLPMGYQIIAGKVEGKWSTDINRHPGLFDFNKKNSGDETGIHNVDKYRVFPRFITGYTSPDNSFNSTYKFQETNGYFIIDLGTNKIYKSLTKLEWLEKLNEYDITREPELFKPSPFDGFLGRNKPQPPYN